MIVSWGLSSWDRWGTGRVREFTYIKPRITMPMMEDNRVNMPKIRHRPIISKVHLATSKVEPNPSSPLVQR